MTVFRPSNSVWYAIRTSNAHTIMWQFGLPGDLSLAGNFDGDNKTDFAVYRVSTGLWYASSSATGQTIERLYGAPGDVPDPGDYDGDGITDFAVYRPSNWSLKRLLAARPFGAGSSDLPKETAWFTSNPQTPDISQGAVNIAIRYNNSMMPVAGEGREISDSQYRIMSEFRFQIRKFLRFSEDTARQSGL